MNWQEFSSRLKPGQEIWIMAHEKPDGDAWGSGFGFGIVMESLGYKPRFIRPSANISTSFSWLPGQHLIHCVPGKSLQPPADALVVVLDCGDIERCEHNLGPVEILLNVDHHVSNPGYGELNWLDTRAGATAQVLCKIFFANGIELPAEAATCFYFALVSDTGGFRFSNTSGETLRIASALIDLGADMEAIRRHLWENRPPREFALLRRMIEGMSLVAEGKGILCPLPYALVMESGIHEAETHTALETFRSIEGVEAVMLLKETEPGLVKLSLRSKTQLDCAAFMSLLGGGGHLRAAGATLHDSVDNAQKIAAELLTKALLDPGAI